MSSCGCIYVDSDYPTVMLTMRDVRARVAHVCTECDRVIEPGEMYEIYKGVHEGAFFTQKTCRDCLSIRAEFYCDGWYWEEIIERVGMHVFDMQGEISSDCLLRLTPRARDMVIGFIDNYWDDCED